jgi:hypothetical protein
MNATLTCPFLELDTQIPDQLFVLKHPPSGKYGCYCHQGVHGLACFSTESGAFRFAEWIDLGGMASEQVSFDEAREIAKQRPMPIVSLMLLDNLGDPVIHFVR